MDLERKQCEWKIGKINGNIFSTDFVTQIEFAKARHFFEIFKISQQMTAVVSLLCTQSLRCFRAYSDIYHSNVHTQHGWLFRNCSGKSRESKIIANYVPKSDRSCRKDKIKSLQARNRTRQLFCEWENIDFFSKTTKMTEIEMPMDVVPGTSGITTNTSAATRKQHLPW